MIMIVPFLQNKKPTLSSGLVLLNLLNYSNATLAILGKGPESKSKKTGVGERHRNLIIPVQGVLRKGKFSKP
jgi:hypothetical protein